jgi:hypothetical protein
MYDIVTSPVMTIRTCTTIHTSIRITRIKLTKR